MIKVIRNLLSKIIDDIDAGNSNISGEEALEVIATLKKYSDKSKRLSKYQACQYLNVSRATFDGYVREGLLPRGEKEAGFKELFWAQKDLDNFIKSRSNGNRKNY